MVSTGAELVSERFSRVASRLPPTWTMNYFSQSFSFAHLLRQLGTEIIMSLCRLALLQSSRTIAISLVKQHERAFVNTMATFPRFLDSRFAATTPGSVRFYRDGKKGSDEYEQEKEYDDISEKYDYFKSFDHEELSDIPKKSDFFDDDDPFGVFVEDEKSKLPPMYKRDAATGRMTGEIEKELSESERKALKANPLEQSRLVRRRMEKHWEEEGVDESGQPAALDRLGEGVRRSDMALNVFGRSSRAQATQELLEDGSAFGRDKSRLSQPLTPKEFKTMNEFLKKMDMMELTTDDIPVMEEGKYVGPVSVRFYGEKKRVDPDDTNLALKWLSARAQRQMDDSVDDNPYADLLPQDLRPTRLVNRKRAKPIPREVLHHNNIALLKSFMTPTGQIQSRVQTRLGARDQRKVAKLIKRARHMGLVPYQSPFKAEQRGWIHAEDIHENREWEDELIKRGLVIKRSTNEKHESDLD